MPEIDASEYQALSQAVKSLPADQLLAQISGQDGGAKGVLDQVFDGMAGAFNPAKAGGQSATVEFDITTPQGVERYALQVADGNCTVHHGGADSPRTTIKAGLVDFLKLITNNLNPMQAFMTGKLKVDGDLFFAQTAMNWFERPTS
jgi:putative sterol carrier protein